MEWVFRNMLMIIKPGAVNNGFGNFKNIYSSLLKEIGLSSEEYLLDIARCLRNTIHNNGFFCNQNCRDYEYIYRDRTIKFIHNSNEHLATSIMFYIIEDLILLCRKIIDIPRISSYSRMDFVIT